MIEFIIKYWIDFLLGLIISILSFACKKFYNLYQSEKQLLMEKEQIKLEKNLHETTNKVNQESQQGDIELQRQIDIIIAGILNVQGKNFKQTCRELLQGNKEITIAEFEAIQEDYNVYKSLGGNHDGDTLFDMVLKKATHDLTD